ncbi:MAG: hypothetical protein R2941_07785 [Desulfobacterales bacterium]
MNMLTVTEFFTFIVIIVIILLVLICWKIYRFEKRQAKAPSLTALGEKLDDISGQTGNIGAIQGKLAELSSKTDSIGDLRKSLAEFSETLSSVSAKADKSEGVADSLASLGQDMQLMLDALSERIDNLARQVEDLSTVNQKVSELRTDTDQMKQQIEDLGTVHMKLLSDISSKMENIVLNALSAVQKKTAVSEPAENRDSSVILEQEAKPDLKIPVQETPSAGKVPSQTVENPASLDEKTKQKSHPKTSAQTEHSAETPVGETVQKPSHDASNPAEQRERAMSKPDDAEEQKKQELLARI